MLLRTSTATLLAGAVLGGAVGGGAVAAIADGGSTTTTTVAAAPAATGATAAAPAAHGAAAVYRRVSPSVVQITAVSTGSGDGSPFGDGGGGGAGEATGSGFVVDSSGLIVTNDHVVSGASKLTVTLADGAQLKATVVGKDGSSDLALLRVDPGSHTLTALQLSDDSGLAVGDTTYAIGSPYGLQGTLTTGVVSALHREITAPNGFSISNAIQTDAELNPGNSGGPLLDATGRVIGVNSQIKTESGDSNAGVGFAVPVETIKQVVPQIQSGRKVERAFLGVSNATTDNQSGATVTGVVPGGPAQKAGIRQDDKIVAIDNRPISSSDDVSAAVAAHRPGQQARVTVIRGGNRRTLTVTLGTRPEKAGG
jgi:S1-C subfamily serine protease